MEELRRLQRAVPREASIYYLMGKILKSMGSDDLALQYFTWAASLDPKTPASYFKDPIGTEVGEMSLLHDP